MVAEKKPSTAKSHAHSSSPKHKPAASAKVKTKVVDPMMAPVSSAPSTPSPSVAGIKAADIGGPVVAPVKPRTKHNPVGYIVGAIVAVIVVVLVVFGVLIYGYRSDSATVRTVSGIIPYPVMKVGNDYVSYHEYLFNLDANKQYLENQATTSGEPAVNFSSAAGQKRLATLRAQVLAQLKSDEVTRQLIKQNKVVVTNQQLNAQYNQIVNSNGGTTKLKEVLTKDYGWSLANLKTVLKFQLQKQALSTKITSNAAANAQAKAKAQDVLNQIHAGGDFATLAKKYSQDASAANGGDLGFISKGQTGDTALETTAFGQQPGQVSAVVKSQYGYEIVKTIEFNAGKTQVHPAEILIKSVDFTDYLSQQVKNTKSSVYIKS